MDTPGGFSAIFFMADNFHDFLFAFLHKQIPSKNGYTLKRKNLLPLGANSFVLEYTPSKKKAKIIIKELPPLKMYPFPWRPRHEN